MTLITKRKASTMLGISEEEVAKLAKQAGYGQEFALGPHGTKIFTTVKGRFVKYAIYGYHPQAEDVRKALAGEE